jgi:predicted AAA+ superfamily ATPase
MTTLKPWRELAIPHTDVLHGRFAQAEYAADLTQVHAGKASPEYQEAAKFFERTFITEGMRLLLDAVVRRLAGKGGDPVIQLQTAFGGGKTHTMLAVYHLAMGKTSPSELAGVAPILDGAGILNLTPARIAVLDGNDLAANQAKRTPEGLQLRTLWGHLAYQLGGHEGYALVADSDTSGTSPGKEVLVQLLERHQPCVILLDEMVAYLRQFEEGKPLLGGTFDSILSFMQALTESVKLVPSAILLASLPESEVEVGSDRGKQALAALEKVFGRIQALWKPVSSEESFEIVRRRLFEPIRDEQGREAVCRHFHDAYVQYSDQLPTDVVEGRYYQRMLASYPLHPEIFDRLYEDWSTLQGFQRTRGVLKLMSKVLHQLWKDNHQELMILPSAIRLDATEVRNDLVYYLSQGFDPVIERDIDGPRAESVRIDQDESRFGQLQAARKAARCIFLGGAPAAQDLNRIGAQKANRGIDVKHILLGCYRPGDNIAIYLDVLGRLRDRLHYLSEANGFYYLDTRPNLRREMEERKRRFEDREHVFPLLKTQLERLMGKGTLPVHIFSPSADIPDERAVRLVVLGPEVPLTSGKDSLAEKSAYEILAKRGESPRMNQNALLFLAPEYTALMRVKDQLRTVLAWESIVKDVEKKSLNLDFAQFDQAKLEHLRAEKVIPASLRETFKILLVPFQTSPTDREIQLEKVSVSASSTTSLLETITRALREEDHLIDQWAPIHLRHLLERYYWKDDVEAKAAKAIADDLCRYVYMPRLLKDDVFQQAVRDGARDGQWAVANGVQDGKYQGLKLGADQVYVDQSLLLVTPEAAQRQLASEVEVITVPPTGQPPVGPPSPPTGPGPTPVKPDGSPVATQAPPIVRYIGTKTFEGAVGTTQIRPMLDEIHTLLVAAANGRVKLRIEIEGECPAGFSEQTLRALRENSRSLGVDAEFDK